MNNNKFLTYLTLVSLFCTSFHLVCTDAEVVHTVSQSSNIEHTHSTTLPRRQKSIRPKYNPMQTFILDSLYPEETSYQKFIDYKVKPRIKPVDPKVHRPKYNQMHSVLKSYVEAGAPHGNIPVRKMNEQQLEDIYNFSLNYYTDLYMIAEVLGRLISLSHNHAQVKHYKLALADTHYQLNHIEVAATLYEDFAALYPGSQEAEYALFKAVVCMFELSLDADRDQSNTKKTVLLAKEYLKRPHAKKELKQEIEMVLGECYDRLYEHEVYVFNFYLKNKKFPACRLRLDFIKTVFEELIPNFANKQKDLEMQLELAINPLPVVSTKKTTRYKFLG